MTTILKNSITALFWLIDNATFLPLSTSTLGVAFHSNDF